MPLPRLLILPALAALFALALTAPPASAQPAATCPCWPGGVPLASPLICYASPGPGTNTFAYIPPFLQATDFWCRNNASFGWTSAAQSAACDESLQCLCGQGATEEVTCNATDDDCNPATLDAAAEVCDNGLDDDCDGDADLADSDCDFTVQIQGGDMAVEGGVIKFTLHLDMPVTFDVVVTLGVMGVGAFPAQPGTDFDNAGFFVEDETAQLVQVGNMITITAGTQWVDFFVKTTDDADDESTESFKISILDVCCEGLIGVADTAVGSIKDNDGPEFCNNGTDDNSDGSTDEAGCILAVAYVDVNSNDVFDAGDGLIAALRDTNGSGVADAGDVMETDVFPTTLPDPPVVGGTFGVKSSPCVSALQELPTRVRCVTSNQIYRWDVTSGSEIWESGALAAVIFGDVFGSGFDNLVFFPALTLAPNPAALSLGVAQPGDQNFLDVDIFP